MRAYLIFCSINFLWVVVISVALLGYGRKHLSNLLTFVVISAALLFLELFLKHTNSFCISSQHFRVITTPVTRSSKIRFLVGCRGNKQINFCLVTRTNQPSSPLLAYSAFMMWQNAEKFQRYYQIC